MSEEVAPAGIDITKPNVARVYDYMAGGKDHYAVDRAASELFIQLEPNAKSGTVAHRAFLGRVVRYMAREAGIRQFIDIGSGLPTAENTHEIAQRADPAARVVYVDNDPVVVTHAKALIGETSTTHIIAGDIREPAAILNDPVVRDFIDFSQPVGLVLLAILHHVGDAEDPGGIAKALRDAVVPGSHLAISHFCDPGAANPKESAAAKEGERAFMENFGTGRWRTPAEIEAYFGDWRLLDPGLIAFPLWRPDTPWEGEMPGYFYRWVGGVAVKDLRALISRRATIWPDPAPRPGPGCVKAPI